MSAAHLERVRSADGTTIAFERSGSGAAAILIGGAFNDRSTVAGLAATLAPHLTAVTYDRRSRGESGGSTDYNTVREIEDLDAVIGALGGGVCLFGHSSGAVLALQAAAAGLPIRKLAAYEPSYVVDDSRSRPAAELGGQIQALVAGGRGDDAAALFLSEAVSLPAEVVQGMRAGPAWPFFAGFAPSLPFDVAVCGPGMRLPADLLATISIPALVLNGSDTSPWLAAASSAVAAAVPGAVHRVVEGQDHGVLQRPDALREVLVEFFRGEE